MLGKFWHDNYIYEDFIEIDTSNNYDYSYIDK